MCAHCRHNWISQYYYFFAIKIKINPILQCKCVMREIYTQASMQESIHVHVHAHMHTPHPHTIVPSAQQISSSCKLVVMFISLLYIQVQLFTESVQVLLPSRRYGLGGRCLYTSHNHIQGFVWYYV